MNRVTEPVIMENPLNCQAFANANRKFVEKMFLDELTRRTNIFGKILDLGSGTCEFDLALLTTSSTIEKIIAVDASVEMCNIGRTRIDNSKIEITCSYFSELNAIDSDITISTLTLHHQTNPMNFWEVIKKNTKKNGYIFVMDLIRPDRPETIEKIVEYLAPYENELYKKDFSNSLAAAFTIDEIKQQLIESNLNLSISTIGSSNLIMIIYGKNI